MRIGREGPLIGTILNPRGSIRRLFGSPCLPRLSISLLACLCYILSHRAVAEDDPLNNWHWRNPLPQGNILYDVAYGITGFVAIESCGVVLTH